MANKAETRAYIKNFVHHIETQFEKHVKVIQKDPEQNGIVEQKHQHLLNVTQALLFSIGFASFFLVFCSLNAAYLQLHSHSILATYFTF